MSVCLHVYLHMYHVRAVSSEAREGHRSTGNGVIDNCKLPMWILRIQLQSPAKATYTLSC